MTCKPITVVETPPFLSQAEGVLSEAERTKLVNTIAMDPEAGTRLGGGIRKIRVPTGGSGKSGGARLIYYFYNESIPVFLLAVFAKSSAANLSNKELAKLIKVAKQIPKTYGV